MREEEGRAGHPATSTADDYIWQVCVLLVSNRRASSGKAVSHSFACEIYPQQAKSGDPQMKVNYFSFIGVSVNLWNMDQEY